MWDYIRELSMIEKDFSAINYGLEEPERTRRLVHLMNELEANYGAFKVDSTQEDMEQPAMRLYRRISAARKL